MISYLLWGFVFFLLQLSILDILALEKNTLLIRNEKVCIRKGKTKDENGKTVEDMILYYGRTCKSEKASFSFGEPQKRKDDEFIVYPVYGWIDGERYRLTSCHRYVKDNNHIKSAVCLSNEETKYTPLYYSPDHLAFTTGKAYFYVASALIRVGLYEVTKWVKDHVLFNINEYTLKVTKKPICLENNDEDRQMTLKKCSTKPKFLLAYTSKDDIYAINTIENWSVCICTSNSKPKDPAHYTVHAIKGSCNDSRKNCRAVYYNDKADQFVGKSGGYFKIVAPTGNNNGIRVYGPSKQSADSTVVFTFKQKGWMSRAKRFFTGRK